MPRLAIAAFTAALLAGCATAPLAPTTPTAVAPLPPSVTSELPRSARPLHYVISVTPDASALTFTGHEAVTLQVFEPTTTLTLNAAMLEISAATLAPSGGGPAQPLAVALDAERETATFTAPAALAAGEYVLTLDYRGRINTQPSGLFALDYKDKRTGQPARALYTQFEVPDAREFAPMFDEPSYKATFTLSAVVPESQLAVSNMPVAREELLGNGMKRVTFATSPKMSSYLLFFASGDFERLSKRSPSGTEVGIVSVAGTGETARYALDELAELLPYYNDYFGVAYPLPKLDNVTGPGQSQQFGAMENWGAIFSFERSLLYDPRNTSPERLNYIYTAQAHEVAHQWFGDLVTMAWWDDLWLNEGFASWMETKATDHFHPEWFERVGRVNARERAMGLDALSSSHPIVVPIRVASEANDAFDTISYSKGEAILAMFEAYAGEDRWRDGIRRYFAAHAYGNTVTAHFWRAQEPAGAVDIAAVADGFTRQPGVPLLTATSRCEAGSTRLELTQGEFSRDRREEVSRTPRRWRVPVTVRAADGSLHPALVNDRAELTLPGCGPVIVNGGQLGYFRTLYTPAALTALTERMAQLEPVDQLGLFKDNLALAAGAYQPYAPAIEMLAAVSGEANPIVGRAAVESWGGLYGRLVEPADQARMAQIVHATWWPRLEALGFDPKPGEPFPDSNLRAQLLATFGNLADPSVIAEARRRFARLRTDRTALDGPLKTAWLTIIARNANAEEWEFLRALGRTAPDASEKALYYSLLGDAVDPVLAQRSLDLALTDEAGATSRAVLVRSVAAHHPELAFDFAVAHDAAVMSMLDDYSKSDFVPGLLTASTDTASIARLETMREARSENDRTGVNKALASLRERIASTPRIRAEIETWVRARR